MNKLLVAASLILFGATAQAAPAGAFGDPADTLNRYVFVENADAVAHEVGDVVVWSDMATMKVATTTTAANPVVAGVVVFNDLPASGKGFIQTYGYHAGVTIAVANADKAPLVTSTTAEAAGVHTIATSTTTVGADFGVFAIALEATTSSTTVKSFIRIGPGQ